VSVMCACHVFSVSCMWAGSAAAVYPAGSALIRNAAVPFYARGPLGGKAPESVLLPAMATRPRCASSGGRTARLAKAELDEANDACRLGSSVTLP
jgi:hypothetical protein